MLTEGEYPKPLEWEMPDITKCENKECPLKETCYRFISEPDEWQSYIDFKYDNGCKDYWEVKR